MMLEAADSLHGLRVGGWHPWRFDRLKVSGGFLAVVGSHAQLHDVRADRVLATWTSLVGPLALFVTAGKSP